MILALSASTSACIREAVEVKVRDPGRVQVAERTPAGPVPVVPPDGRPVRVRLPQHPSGATSITRRERSITVDWPDTPGVIVLDEDGKFPQTRGAGGIHFAGPFIYAGYDVTSRGVSEPGKAQEAYLPLELSTPVDNVESAQHVREKRRWPGYVLVPVGAVMTLVGLGILATRNRNDEFATLLGGLYLAAGAPTLGWGLYVLLDPAEVTPIRLVQ